MNKHLTRAALATVASGTLLAGIATVASAADGSTGTTTPKETTVDQAKSHCDQLITTRVDQLTKLSKATADSKALTAEHRTELNGLISTAMARLTAIKTTSDAESTIDGVRTACAPAIGDLRVFVLKTPQVRLVIGADRATAAIAEARAMADKLEAAINAAKAKGENVTMAQADLAAARADLTKAENDLAGLAAKVMALQPGDYNANHAILAPLRTAEKNALDHLRGARAQGRDAMKALKDAKGPKDAKPAPKDTKPVATTNG